MYEVFDRFCKVPTWDTPHALDEERFRAALSEVVHLAGFSPAEMGRYIKLNHVEPIWPKTVAQLELTIARKRALLAHWLSDVNTLPGAPHTRRSPAAVTVSVDHLRASLEKLDEMLEAMAFAELKARGAAA